jgi:Na+-transporting methylmalonyl-CoA/oxaloacetate decarboxylase gamma subunit
MQLFRETFTIMVIGMSLVFFFLFIVIQCMNLIAFMVRRYEASHPALPPDEPGRDETSHRHLVAAIAVATELITEKN